MNRVIKISAIIIGLGAIGYFAHRYYFKGLATKKNKAKSLADIKSNLNIEKAIKKRKFDVQPNLKETNVGGDKSSFKVYV